jgi:putative redox protein
MEKTGRRFLLGLLLFFFSDHMSAYRIGLALKPKATCFLLIQRRVFIHNHVVLAGPACPSSRREMTTQQHDDDDDTVQYQKSYRLTGLTTANNKSGVTVTTNTGHTLTTDVPKKMGGKDSAPQPVEILLTALTGCTQATALFVGRQMNPDRLVLDRLEFDLHAVRDERGALHLPVDQDPPVPSRLNEVTGTIVVYQARNKPIDPDLLQLLKEQTELRCPVANMMMASGCKMLIEWIDGSTLA